MSFLLQSSPSQQQSPQEQPPLSRNLKQTLFLDRRSSLPEIRECRKWRGRGRGCRSRAMRMCRATRDPSSFPEDEEWSSFPDLTHLSHLDRGFVFPGEQINILVTVSSRDLTVPEIFKVAAVINKNALLKANPVVTSSVPDESSEGQAAREALRKEWHKKKSVQLLESFQRSHFYVSIVNENDSNASKERDEEENVEPVVMERDGFDPVGAGGIARRAITSCALANGDIVVVLQVTVVVPHSISDMEEFVLEVLQFEQHSSPMSASKTIPKDLDPAQDLLHWLLPLDRHAFMTPQQHSASATNLSSTSQRLSFAAANSTLFSFSHLRSSSAGSLPQVTSSVPPLPTPPYPPSALNTAPGEWNKLYPEKDVGSQEVGSEGLLSFRGVPLEPQRFSAHCGLEGLYVPGKRWCKKISIVQPLAVRSYFADCNAEDLICVLIENVLPGSMSDVIVYIDSISIICQASGPGTISQPIPSLSVEAGEEDKLPNLPLRTGEQHSFILRPTSSLIKPPEAPSKQVAATRQGSEAKNYAVIVACHCSHTHSRFYVKHSLKWKPRPARDFLISVSLENTASSGVSNAPVPELKSQVVTVQATNLTSKDLDLTLLAPSAPAHSPVPVPSISNAKIPQAGNSHSFQEERAQHEKSGKNATSFSLPHGSHKTKEQEEAVDVKEGDALSLPTKTRTRRIPAAEVLAESCSARTHLWLQSTVPLGRLPAHSTTVVKCDMLPLTDGIITLDTLHLATTDREALFAPTSPLQLHSAFRICDKK